MATETLKVPKISCGHCVNAIREELSSMAGVKQVTGDPQQKSITVDWESPATLETIRAALKGIDYPAE
jgi:copper chaperone CopZ